MEKFLKHSVLVGALLVFVLSLFTTVLAVPNWEFIAGGRYNVTNITTGTQWAPGLTYQFNITWNETNSTPNPTNF